MRVTVNHDLKIIQFWCTNNITRDELCNIESICENCLPNEKYRNVIYKSGGADLRVKTEELLKHNLGIFA